MLTTDLLKLSANKNPFHPVIKDVQGEINYLELNEAVKETSLLLKNYGIGKGVGVGVMGNNSRNFVIAAFAVMDSGAVVMPISGQVCEPELKEMIGVSKLHAILLEPGCSTLRGQKKNIPITFKGQVWELWFSDNVLMESAFVPHVPDAALVRFTSGTTGTSKGVILSHKSINERTALANKSLQLSEKDVILWVLSMAYHFVVSIILYIRYGCTIVINHDFMATTLLDEINRYQATFFYGSPMHIRLLAADTSSTNIDSIRKVISTSTAISKELCDSFMKRFGKPVIQAYGIIEIGLPIINDQKSTVVPDAIGFAVPGYEVNILNDDGLELPDGITGHLAIRGPGMFEAYMNPPLMRNEVLHNGWFLTGDLASKQTDGLVKIEGRKKSMINVAGNKVFPEEVENVINCHPDVILSRVSGYMHRLLGECVAAEVILNPEAKHLDGEKIRSFCKQHLSSYKVPQKIVFVESLPMTMSGKLKRT